MTGTNWPTSIKHSDTNVVVGGDAHFVWTVQECWDSRLLCSVWDDTAHQPCLWLGVCFVLVVFVGGFCGGVTPGPFPNPEAKPTCADGTAPGRVWESKTPPALNFIVGSS